MNIINDRPIPIQIDDLSQGSIGPLPDASFDDNEKTSEMYSSASIKNKIQNDIDPSMRFNSPTRKRIFHSGMRSGEHTMPDDIPEDDPYLKKSNQRPVEMGKDALDELQSVANMTALGTFYKEKGKGTETVPRSNEITPALDMES